MMRNKILFVLATLSLSACSLIERNPEADFSAPPLPNGMSTSNAGEEASPGLSNELFEKELSRLNAKLEALETKVEVLTNNLEKQQLKNSQPIISAEPSPLTNSNAAMLSATAHGNLEPITNRQESSLSLSNEETQFRTAMELFQNGKNLEAGAAFLNFSKLEPRHHLAPHALYWAGESNARAEQWKLAVSSWENLQVRYPRSAYLPEALAGLVRGYSAVGESSKAQMARSALLNSFPQAPAALSLQSTSPVTTTYSSEARTMNHSEDGARDVENVDEEGITPQEETQ